jgi:hypothetical protein
MAVLIALIFSKFFYLASITSYYTFYLMHRFGLSIETAQIYLFVFLTAAAAGLLVGGPVGDKFGRKKVIWGSIVGVLPLTLALPHVGLTATLILSVFIGLILSSAFSAIVVYGQELMPGRVGMVTGLFFGLAFGMGGIGAEDGHTCKTHGQRGFAPDPGRGGNDHGFYLGWCKSRAFKRNAAAERVANEMRVGFALRQQEGQSETREIGNRVAVLLRLIG